MQFLESIQFKRDVEVESSRAKHLRMFKVKKKFRVIDDRSKPLPPKNSERLYERQQYAKKRIYYNTFNLFEMGLECVFDDITIIVGDNGSGKSSLLNYLKPPKDEGFMFSFDKTQEELNRERVSKWLDNDECKLSFVKAPQLIVVEKQIHKGEFINNIGKGQTTLTANQVLQRWSMQEDSNGETTIDFLTSLSKLEDSLIILDEPETSLSIRSQIRLAKLLKKIAKKNQLIIVTHSPIFMQISNEVYDFEEKLYVNTKTYIDEQYRL